MVSARLASPARRRATSPHERHAPHTPPSPRPPACQMPRRSRPIIASCMCTAAICTLCKTPHTTPAPPRPALPRRAQSTPQHPNDPTPRRAHLAAAPTPMYITPQLPPPPFTLISRAPRRTPDRSTARPLPIGPSPTPLPSSRSEHAPHDRPEPHTNLTNQPYTHHCTLPFTRIARWNRPYPDTLVGFEINSLRHA
jgi:hypothetical protein